MAHVDPAYADVVVLEEPEHLNWYRNGPRWTSRFRHVVGVGHTNYEAYAKTENRGARLAERVFTETVTRAHCDVVVQLSATLRPLPHSRVSNVHGVRRRFLDVGDAGGPAAFARAPGANRCYFLGKALWAKGYDQLAVLLGTSGDGAPRIDCFGGGPDAAEIEAAAARLAVHEERLGHDGIDPVDVRDLGACL
jgi:digalactosyldiacylglycerol synthase